MNFSITAAVPPTLADTAIEIRLALGLEPIESRLELYRPFLMDEFSDELDVKLIELFRAYNPIPLKIAGRMQWLEESGLLVYPLEIPAELGHLHQKLVKILPPETNAPASNDFALRVTLGYISALGRNQRDLVDNFYFPVSWTINRLQLESEVKPAKWLLEAAYTLGEN